MTQFRRHVDAEVSVIGAGPVGSLLAGLLALNGVDVLLFDERDDVPEGPRAMAVNARTAQILEVLDLKAHLLTVSPSTFGHYGRKKMNLAAADTPWPGMWPVLQQAFNRKLINWAVDAGAQLVRGARYLSSSARTDGLIHAAFDGGRIQSSTSHMLVGCDGEESSVRSSSRMGLTAVAGERRFVTANVRSADLPIYRFKPFADGAVVSSGRIDARTHRIMMHIPTTTPPLTDADDVATTWARITGSAFQGEVASWGLQTDRSVVADSFRDGNVLLAGDAAHSQLPVGGSSLNYGIEDAFSLAWRIKHSLETETTRLLDDYATERKFAAQRLQRFVDAQIEALYGTHPIHAANQIETAMVPADPAAFLSGIDIDYQPCQTGAAGLLSATNVSLSSSQTLGLKKAQRSFQYSRIRFAEGDHQTSRKLQELRSTESRLGHRSSTPDEAFLLVRPDGYVLTDA